MFSGRPLGRLLTQNCAWRHFRLVAGAISITLGTVAQISSREFTFAKKRYKVRGQRSGS